MEANGLRLFRLYSKSNYLDKIEDVFESTKNFIRNPSNTILYLDYEVRIGRFESGKFSFHETFKETDSFDPKFLIKLRIFNKNEELYIWRSNGNLFGRYRIDGADGENIDIVEAKQILFGTKSTPHKGWTELSEERGTRLILPGTYQANDASRRVAIQTYNYVGTVSRSKASGNTGIIPCMATYIDCRFVDFVQC